MTRPIHEIPIPHTAGAPAGVGRAGGLRAGACAVEGKGDAGWSLVAAGWGRAWFGLRRRAEGGRRKAGRGDRKGKRDPGTDAPGSRSPGRGGAGS